MCRRRARVATSSDDDEGDEGEPCEDDEDDEVGSSAGEELEVAKLVQRQLRRLKKFTHVNEREHPIPSHDWDSEIRYARRMRRILKNECRRKLCAVCSISHPRDMVKPYHYEAVPNLSLLLADEEKTEECPRDAKTVYEWDGATYCLQPAACGEEKVSRCGNCHASLGREKVPPDSLVRVDTGSIPRGPSAELTLEPLRMIEERLLGQLHVFRCVVVIKPEGSWKPHDACQRGHRSHIVAVPYVSNREVATVLQSLKTLSDHTQVVFISVSSSKDDVAKLAKKAAVLHVRGPLLLKWAKHLCNVSEDGVVRVCGV